MVDLTEEGVALGFFFGALKVGLATVGGGAMIVGWAAAGGFGGMWWGDEGGLGGGRWVLEVGTTVVGFFWVAWWWRVDSGWDLSGSSSWIVAGSTAGCFRFWP